MDEPNFWAVVPAYVRYDDSLVPNAKLLYGEISAMTKKEGFCWAENKHFAQLYKVDNNTISRWISQLEKAGHIDVYIDKINGNARKIFIDKRVFDLLMKKSKPIYKKVDRVSTKKKEAIYNNVESINRINSKSNNTINSEEKALEFLTKNYPSRMEAFLMKYKTKIKDFEAFENDYNCKVVEEQKEWVPDVLFARLERLANNWIRNDQKQNKTEEPAHSGKKAFDTGF